MTETKYYVTKQGLQKIEKDYQNLLEFKKKKTTGEEVPSIWHSEEVNPDYLTFQEDMNLLEAKLGEFERMLKNVEIIVSPPQGKAKRGMPWSNYYFRRGARKGNKRIYTFGHHGSESCRRKDFY